MGIGIGIRLNFNINFNFDLGKDQGLGPNVCLGDGDFAAENK